DVISDDNYFNAGTDVLSFGVGITATDIVVNRSGNSLLLNHVNGQDGITILNWFVETTGRYQLERIEFADGTLWTREQLSSAVLQQTGTEGADTMVGAATGNQSMLGLGGNDSITGGLGNDWLEGGRGNDTLNGGQGSDRYVFNLGDGKDV
ncbi:calcium-binding protein, partial [Pseudomonas sp. AIG]